MIFNGGYGLGSIKEIANEMLKNCITENNLDFSKLISVDIAVDFEPSESIENISNNCTGWYGTELITTKFDESPRFQTVVADYYGGGSSVSVMLDSEDTFEENVSLLENLLSKVLEFEDIKEDDEVFFIVS